MYSLLWWILICCFGRTSDRYLCTQQCCHMQNIKIHPVSHYEIVHDTSCHIFELYLSYFSGLSQSSPDLAWYPWSNFPAVLWCKQQTPQWFYSVRWLENVWCLNNDTALYRLKYRKPTLALQVERNSVKRSDYVAQLLVSQSALWACHRFIKMCLLSSLSRTVTLWPSRL